jgi:hypothetical protein
MTSSPATQPPGSHPTHITNVNNQILVNYTEMLMPCVGYISFRFDNLTVYNTNEYYESSFVREI